MWADADATDPLSKPAGMHNLRLALLGLAALVALFLGWTVAHQSARPADPTSAGTNETRTSPQQVAAMRRIIERAVTNVTDYAGFFSQLRVMFPAEYDSFLTRAAERAAANGQAADADALTIEAARDLRRSHGVLAAKADGPVLDHYFATKRALLEALAAKSQTLCVDLLYGGNGDFSAFSRDHRGLFANIIEAGLDAIRDGQANQVERDPPSDEDFRTLENALRAQGVSNAAIGALLDGRAPNPPLDDDEMCQAGQIFLQTLAVLPDAARRRIYAFAVELMAHS
jgi:hypothetical protein